MKTNYTHIAVILDRSGSMQALIKDVIGGFNTFVKEQKALPGEATFTLVQFDDKYEVVHDFVDIQKVPTLTEETYNARNMTALLDAVGVTIKTVGEKLAAMPEDQRPSKVLVSIYTDGQENSSKEYNWPQIAKMIKTQRETYGWEFTFTGVGSEAFAEATAGQLGIDPLLVAQMQGGPQGAVQMMNLCSVGASSYRSGGSQALRSAYIKHSGQS